jgi:hypothetical protein
LNSLEGARFATWKALGEDWEARNVPRKNTDKGSRPVKNPHKHVGKKDMFGFCFDGLAFGWC